LFFGDAYGHVMGYYTIYEAASTPPSLIEYSKLTHVALAAAVTDAKGVVSPVNYETPEWNWQSFVSASVPRAHAAGTKAILMLGGAGTNPNCPANGPFNLATRPELVSTFAKNLVDFAQRFQFDGIDLDWEECINSTALSILAKELRQRWPAAYISIPINAIGMNTPQNDPTMWLASVPYVDALNTMSYIPPDNWGGWDGPWHVSPLLGDAAAHPYSIKLAVDTITSKGIPKSKLGIGIGFFGSCWGPPIVRPIQNLGSNRRLADDGAMSYRNIEANYRRFMSYNYDNVAQVPYLNSSTAVGPVGCSYISFDDEISIKAKAEYVRTQGLAGVIIWTVGEGYLADGRNPALDAVYHSFGQM